MEPINKVNTFNSALPAAEASLAVADLTPVTSPGYLLVYFWSPVAGVLRFARTRAGVTVTEDMNGGVALAANAGYQFSISWESEDIGNFRYSSTGNNYTLIVDEYGED